LGYYYLTLALIAGGALGALRARKIIAPIETLAFLVALAYGFIYFNFVDWMPGMRYYAALVGTRIVHTGCTPDAILLCQANNSVTFPKGSEVPTIRHL
jgi:hypothetical protein